MKFFSKLPKNFFLIILVFLISFYLGFNFYSNKQDEVGYVVTSTQSSTPSPNLEPTIPGAKYINLYVTFYGWADNDPSGKNIAYPISRYPKALHSEAGGTGTYDDPLTFASDPDEWPIGTLLYIPYLKKYVVMEDWCSVCVDDWQENKKYHIDIWMDSNETYTKELLDCENHWTRRRTKVEIDPPAGRQVSTTPLFDKTSGKCL